MRGGPGALSESADHTKAAVAFRGMANACREQGRNDKAATHQARAEKIEAEPDLACRSGQAFEL